MPRFALRSSAPVVGLDLGGSAVAAVELRSRGDRTPVVTGAAIWPVPPGLLVDGEVVDAAELGRVLAEFWRTAGFSSKRVRLGVANQRVLVREVRLPIAVDDTADLRRAVEFQAQEEIAIPLEDAVLDFHVLPAEDGEPGVRVVVAAAYRDTVQRYVDAAKAAGLSVAGIDVEPFALLRSLTPLRGDLDPEVEGMVGFLDVGADLTTLVVAERGVCVFARTLSVAGNAFTDVLVREFDLTAADAEQLKREVALPTPSEPLSADETARRAQVALARCGDDLIDEIERSLQYFRSGAMQRGELAGLLVGGGGGLQGGLVAYLADGLAVPVDPADALGRVNDEKHLLGDGQSARFAVAVGLALEDEAVAHRPAATTMAVAR